MRVAGGSRRVLVRVADRVAGDGSLVRVRALAPLFLNVLLGVVPRAAAAGHGDGDEKPGHDRPEQHATQGDRKSTRLNSSHGYISYAVFCLKKKKNRTSAAACRAASATSLSR